MRKTITVLVILFLALVSFTPIVSSDTNWEENDCWSYKFTYDLEENQNKIKNSMNESLSILSESTYETNISIDINNLEGGFVYLFCIEYQKKVDDQYILTYEGGYYSNLKMNMTMNITGGDDEIFQGNTSINTKMDIDESRIDFEGKLWLEEYTKEFGNHLVDKEMNTLGIKKQTLNTSGEVNTSTQQWTTSSSNGSETNYDIDTSLNTKWMMNLTLKYQPILPWLPHPTKDNDDITEDNQVGIDFFGHLDGEYILDTEGAGMTQSTNKTIDEELKSFCRIKAGLQSNGTNKIYKSSPIKNAPWLGESLLFVKSQDSSFLTPRFAFQSSIGSKSLAKYNETEQFYTDYYMPTTGGSQQISCTSGACSIPTSSVENIDDTGIESEPTDKAEVVSFKSDKKTYYSEHIEPIGSEDKSETNDQKSNLFQEYKYIIIPAFIFTVIVLALAVRFLSSKKKKENF